MRDTLYVFRPGFSDQGEIWFCPYSAQVIGMLTYYPRLRETLDVVELDFAKPRYPVATMLGAENQSLPVLVLGADSPGAAADVKVAEADGVRYVSRTIEILRYLAVTRDLPRPH
jgi:hypothetical protein